MKSIENMKIVGKKMGQNNKGKKYNKFKAGPHDHSLTMSALSNFAAN